MREAVSAACESPVISSSYWRRGTDVESSAFPAHLSSFSVLSQTCTVHQFHPDVCSAIMIALSKSDKNQLSRKHFAREEQLPRFPRNGLAPSMFAQRTFFCDLHGAKITRKYLKMRVPKSNRSVQLTAMLNAPWIALFLKSGTKHENFPSQSRESHFGSLQDL